MSHRLAAGWRGPRGLDAQSLNTRSLNNWARTAAWTGGLTGALLAGIFWAPASWLARGLADASRGHVQLAEVRGTLWRGSAELLLSGGSGSRDRLRLPGRVHWALSPQWLQGMDWLQKGPGLGLQLRADCCTPEPLVFSLGRGASGWQLELADSPQSSNPSIPSKLSKLSNTSMWPTALLAGLGTPWNTLQPSGTLRLSTRQLGLRWAGGQWQLSGQADVELQQFASGLSTLRPLGSYRLRMDGGQPVQLTLSTLEGALRLQGAGQWSGTRLRFSGQAEAEPGREAALDNFLNVVGRRDGPRSIITLGPAS